MARPPRYQVTPNPALHLLNRTRSDPALHFRLADPSDVTNLYDTRQAAIRQLSLTHLSECEAAAWAERGGIAVALDR